MHIGVLGGSGRTGRKVIKEALNNGRDVTTLTRHPSKLDDVSWKNDITILQGDATVPPDLQQLKECDVIVDTTSVGLFHKKPTKLYSSVALALIDAWDKISAQQLFVMSSTGTHHGRNLPWFASWGYEWLLGDVADDKERAEKHYAESSLPWTIIKATKLWPGGVQSYELQDFKDYKPSLFDGTTRKTVAKVICDCIADDSDYSEKKLVVL